MPNDGYTLHAIICELTKYMTGAKVNRIMQPEPDEIIMQLYTGSATVKLLISCNAESARIHLTRTSKENPSAPPTFCMTLRKHLTGASVKRIVQENMDRIVRIEFETLSEMHDTETKTLVAEIMGKHSNIILLSPENRVIAACKTVSLDVSSVRQIFAGLPYTLPPQQDKLFILDTQGITSRLTGKSGNLIKLIASTVTGVSQQMSTEIINSCRLSETAKDLTFSDADKIAKKLKEFYDYAKDGALSPTVTERDFYPLAYTAAQNSVRSFPTMSEAIDEFYELRERHRCFNAHAKNLRTQLKAAISKSRKKLATTLNAIEDSRDFDNDKLRGELITSNIYRIKQGDSCAVVENYYSENAEKIEIELEKNLSPAKNAQRYYRLYARKKKTFDINTEKLPALYDHIDYLESIDAAFSLCTEKSELAEIQTEMEQAGLIRTSAKKKDKTVRASAPLALEYGGYTIKIGKNNAQNDMLTKSAKGDDLWLHVLKEHGSHVIIESRCEEFPSNVIEYAAKLAAGYSSARLSNKVAVDYTLKKYVKKPPKAALGAVIYTNQKTVYVKPATMETS